MNDSAMEQLVGRRIDKVLVGDEPPSQYHDGDSEQYLIFKTDQGDVAYVASGDCCSQTWFADITGVEALVGATVTATEAVEMPENMPDDGRGRQESDLHYGVRITTNKGIADIVYRNSSNGYYGGEICLTTEPLEQIANQREIAEDWQA